MPDSKHSTDITIDQKHSETTKQYTYSELDELFRTNIDKEFNIKREIINNTVVRDATGGGKPEDQVNQNRVATNNMLLRTLGRLRGIDYVLSQKIAENAKDKDQYEQLRDRIKTAFDALWKKAYTTADGADANKHLKKTETAFNATLCTILHEANLDRGCSTQEDYEKLLFHYRNLSTLIDPVKPLVTLSYDKENGILHRIIQTPVTEKTEVQKRAIKKEMKQVVLSPTAEEENVTFQTKQKLAMQDANYYFADLAADDDRMLGAQTRKTHLHGLKNAFIVKNDLFFGESEGYSHALDAEQEPDKTLTYARMATPVYVGKGEEDIRAKVAVRQNFKALKKALPQQESKNPSITDYKGERIAWFNLIGSTSVFNFNHESHMREISEAALDDKTLPITDRLNVTHVYAPPNDARMVSAMDVPREIIDPNNPPDLGTLNRTTDKVKRINETAKALLQANNKGYVPIISCASGQDRTTTLETAAIVQWMTLEALKYKLITEEKPEFTVNLGKEEIEQLTNNEFALLIENACQTNADNDRVFKALKQQVETFYIASRNAAEITSHVVGGSRGLKSVSSAKGLFSEATDDAIYLTSADTNKKNYIASHSKTSSKKDWKILNATLKQPSAIASKEYQAAKSALESCVLTNQQNLNLARAAILKEVTALEPLTHKNIAAVTEALKQATIVIQNPKNIDEIKRLGAIVKGLNKKSTLQKLGNALLFLAGVALVIAGVLLAIPSGGASLLAIVLGTKAIGATAAAVTVAQLSTTAVIGGSVGGIVVGAVTARTAKKQHQGEMHGLSTSLTKLKKSTDPEKSDAESKDKKAEVKKHSP